MKRTLTTLIAALLTLAAPLIARSADTDTPFSTVIAGSCLPEDVAVVGVVHTSTHVTELQGGGIRIDITDKVKGEATGLSSGVKYVVGGKTTQRFILSSDTLESFSYKSGFTLIGPGPSNNLTITYIFKQTPEGVIVDNFNAECK
jgi:hypothetical protein